MDPERWERIFQVEEVGRAFQEHPEMSQDLIDGVDRRGWDKVARMVGDKARFVRTLNAR